MTQASLMSALNFARLWTIASQSVAACASLLMPLLLVDKVEDRLFVDFTQVRNISAWLSGAILLGLPQAMVLSIRQGILSVDLAWLIVDRMFRVVATAVIIASAAFGMAVLLQVASVPSVVIWFYFALLGIPAILILGLWRVIALSAGMNTVFNLTTMLPPVFGLIGIVFFTDRYPMSPLWCLAAGYWVSLLLLIIANRKKFPILCFAAKNGDFEYARAPIRGLVMGSLWITLYSSIAAGALPMALYLLDLRGEDGLAILVALASFLTQGMLFPVRAMMPHLFFLQVKESSGIPFRYIVWSTMTVIVLFCVLVASASCIAGIKESASRVAPYAIPILCSAVVMAICELYLCALGAKEKYMQLAVLLGIKFVFVSLLSVAITDPKCWFFLNLLLDVLIALGLGIAYHMSKNPIRTQAVWH